MSETKAANQSASQADNDEIDIGQIIRTIWGGKWLIILMAMITGAMGAAYAIMATPVYVGNALLQIETKSSGLAALTDLSDAFGGDQNETTTELELLRSRKVILPTIEKFNLKVLAKPKTFPIIGDYYYRRHGLNNGIAEPLFAEYVDFTKDYAWGGEQIIANMFDVPEALYGRAFEIINLGNDKYSLSLGDRIVLEGVVGKRQRNVDLNLNIQIGRLESAVGTHFTIQRFNPILLTNQLAKDLAVSEKGKKSGIVSISLQGTDRKAIKDTVDHILATYQAQNVEYNSIEADKSLDFVEEQLPDATGRLEKSEEELYEYRLNNKTINLSVQSQQILDQLLTIEKGLNELELQEPEVSRKFKREHPVYIEFLRKKSDLEDKKANLNAQATQIPTEQFHIFRLQRDVELNQTIYLQMLNKYEELKIIKAGTLGSIRVIDDTFVEPRAIKPRKSIIFIIAVMVGGMLALGIVLIRAMLFKGIESISQLEDAGHSVYASIPLSATEEKLNKMKPKLGEMRILSESHPEELSVEALRSLRTSLHFAMMEAENNIIMITGPSPGIGKSFISQNLAVLIAQSGNKVLLVDVDLRRGRLHNSFGHKLSPGFSDYLSGVAEFDDICQASQIEGLDVISRGKNPPNPSELLMGETFANFCKDNKNKYDFIILDTPPVLAVTEASIIGKFAGTSMMVVKQNITHMKEIEQANNKLMLSGIEVKGFIFNAISKKSNHQYGYYQYEYK